MVLARVVSFSHAHGVVGEVHIAVVTWSVLEDRLRAWRQNEISMVCMETYRRVGAVSREVRSVGKGKDIYFGMLPMCAPLQISRRRSQPGNADCWGYSKPMQNFLSQLRLRKPRVFLVTSFSQPYQITSTYYSP